MEELNLDVQVRKEVGSRQIKELRRAQFLPGIVYGGELEPTPIKLDKRKFNKMIRGHAGENLIFHLNVYDGNKKLRDYAAIVKDEQYHPVSDELTHIDFKRILLTETVAVKVALTSTGEAIGVKQDGGSLDHTLWEIEVECLPTAIPKSIEVDVSSLTIGDSVHVKELVLPKGVVTKHDPEAVVFAVVPPQKEEEPDSQEESVEPEVIKEKKKSEE